MEFSTRSLITAGVVAVSAGAIVFTPNLIPKPADMVVPSPSLTGTEQAPRTLIDVMDALRTTPVGSAQAAAPTAAPRAVITVGQGPLGDAASDLVDAVYGTVRYWANQGVNTADEIVSLAPLGYVVGDQISLVYYTLVQPIVDSVVYGFVDPILNDPLNVSSYINGAIYVASVAVTSLVNTGITEVNYFLNTDIPMVPAPSRPALGVATRLADTAHVASVPDLVRNALAPLQIQGRAAVADLEKTIDSTETDVIPDNDNDGDGETKDLGLDRTTVGPSDGQPGDGTGLADSDGTTPTTDKLDKPAADRADSPLRSLAVPPGVVSAQGEVRNSITKVGDDLATVLSGKPGAVGPRTPGTPGPVAKAVSDAAKAAISSLRKVGEDVSAAVKKATQPAGAK